MSVEAGTSGEGLEEVFLDTALEGAPFTDKNSSTGILNDVFEDLQNPDLGYLVLSLLVAISWSIYTILFNSRVQGSILTAILRRFVKTGDLTIGSFSLSVLSGKIMFRNVVYVTEDYNLRIVDGILKFRYWLPYAKRELSEDMSHCDHRVWLELNGPELHIYNRSQLYSELEKTFGLDNQLGSGNRPGKSEEDGEGEEGQTQNHDMSFWHDWRDLIPVVKIDLNMARFVFGNRLVASTLLLTTDKAECCYTTKPAACSLDYFMQVLTSKAENFRVILAPSPKYTGVLDEPPRYMGEGFVVMSSSLVHFYYYVDEPGPVPEHPQTMRLPNGDEVTASAPVWGLDIKCAKGTNLSYGPWADRQREQLFRFFCPQDYQTVKMPNAPVPGELRKVQQFDLRLSILTEATIDILFSKEKVTNAVHMNVQRGSYFEMTLPWAINQEGYRTRINGQLFHVDASTSLQYRSLLEAETLDYGVTIHYPRVWNHHQMWDLDFSSSKATYHFLYSHKEFFQDLIEDWSCRVPPDLLHFVPYAWNFTLKLQQFELVTLANGYNWVDCSSQHLANAHVAFCGELFELKFTLPFIDFLPETVLLKFAILAETVDLSLYLPPSNTSRNIITALDRNAKLIDKEDRPKHAFSNDKWRKFCKLSAGWVDCWQVPELQLNIGYTYHPVPPLGPSPQANVSTPEKEELLLSPIRAPHRKKSPMEIIKNITPEQFEPTSMTPDCFSVDLRISQPSEIKLYGSVLRQFIHLKENIFGEDQKFTDMNQIHVDEDNPAELSQQEESKSNSLVEEKKLEFDCRKYRQFRVTVYLDIRNVLGHLVKDCTENDPPCPSVALDRLVFEMDKRFSETQLQVVVSPLILTTSDINDHRPPAHQHLRTGFLMLSGLQMRGHAMFSSEERSLDEETLEYAWLVELTVGTLSGKLTTPQLQNIITALEAFLFTVEDMENCLRHPRPHMFCYHRTPQPQCIHTTAEHFCPTTDVIKYKMVRASIDGLSLNLVESGAILNVEIYPMRVATCNLHGQHTRSGITAHIQNISARNYICAQDGHKEGGGRGEAASMCGTSTSGVGGLGLADVYTDDVWLEAAALTLGPVYVDAATSMDVLHHDMQLIQHKFLKLHDENTKRLWFLWPQEVTKVSAQVFGKCGCVGGCSFFGNNKNGLTFFKPSKQDFYNGVNIAQLRVNDPTEGPGYGQSILHDDQLVFHVGAYSDLAHSHYDSHSGTSKDHYVLSSGYVKSASPATPADAHASRGSSSLHHSSDAHCTERLNPRHSYHREVSVTSHDSNPHVTEVESRGSGGAGDSSTLRATNKDVVLGVPVGTEGLSTPGSLSDLRRSVDNVNSSRQSKMPSSLSLQTELPLHAASGHRLSVSGMKESNSRQSLSSQHSLLASVQRTVSVGSETQSEAFFSADEDQVSKMTVVGNGEGTLSRVSSQLSLPTVPEDQLQSNNDRYSSETSTPPTPHHDSGTLTINSNGHFSVEEGRRRRPSSHSRTRHDSARSNSSCSSSGQSPCLDHSQASLIHSVGSESSRLWECDRPTRAWKKADRIQASLDCSGDSSSEVGSVSSTSFISAVSSQEDIALVDLHMQLNKPITESPLLMSSYINHMTQLRCLNWDASVPSFQSSPSKPQEIHTPMFEKISEGFTAIRMVEGGRHGPPRSPPPPSGRTPSHPYTWDTPIFTWGDAQEEQSHEDSQLQDVVGGVCDSNTTRTTVVIKLKKDVDIMLSPMALESAQLFLEALTPVLESLHPLSIINQAHMRSLSTVAGQNTLKKKRYMYWSRLRDKKVAGTPEQSAVLSTTYQESCFQQMQGQVTVPRINITLLQASVVEEVISFSALDNIRDLTCVSLFSVSLDSVTLQFYSGHQSKKSVQMYMRNPHDPVMQKKSKSKARQAVDLLAEPVYIETSERQQEENMVSVDVNKMHVQLRRLKNESALLKDASVTAIPNHRSKVLFGFRRCARGEDGDNGGASGTPVMEDDRMGFIMCEAGLENVALRAVKRKGFGQQAEGSGRHDVNAPIGNNCAVPSAGSGAGPSCGSAPGTASMEPPRTGPESRRELSDRLCSASVSQMSNMSSHSGVAHSISSANDSTKDLPIMQMKSDKRDITSFMVELRTVWFNFAAPPHTPITKKIDYTRLDWNLLSTASPSINAWMNPSDRLTVAVIQFLHASESRRLGVMASLMAEALDVQSLHVPVKNKYEKLMPLSQTLQEDPSCQLCTVLRRYVLQSSPRTIEGNLIPPHLPKLATLRQGVVVLSRQWKNALYMPLLMEQTFRNKQTRPTYTYRPNTVPEGRTTPRFDPNVIPNEVTDEKTTLLEAEGGSLNSRAGCDGSVTNGVEDVTDGIMSSESTQLPPRRSLPSYPPRSSRASVILPIFNTNFESPARFQFPKIGTGIGGHLAFLRGGQPSRGGQAGDNRSGGSRSSGSDHVSSSSLDGGGGSGLATPGRPPTVNCEKDHENLYNWMVRQQEYAHTTDATRPTVTFPKQGEGLHAMSEGGSERREYPPIRDPNTVLEPPQSAHFLEAHVIFEPLLSAIGVITQQVTGGALEQLGSNVSITGSVETLRVDIIESEASKQNRKKRKTGLHPGNTVGTSGDSSDAPGKFFLDIGSEVPAFLCERVGLEIDVSKVADDSREWVSQQPTLFVSRSALKQHTSTMVHFSLNVNYIAQQVNMPLLRLLHQISSMYQNARETQLGLREQRPTRTKDTNLPSHRKEGSYSELHEGEYKGNEYSLSISEEQATVSSLAGIKGPRGSVVSSLSARISPPPTTSRVNRPQSFAQRLRSSTKMSKGYTNLGTERGTGSPLFSISVSGSGLEGATICSSDKSPLLGPPEASTPPAAVTATPKCWRNIYYLLDLYTTTPETKTVQQRSSVTVEASDGYKGSRKYDILKESKQSDLEAGPLPSVPSPPVVADKTKELGLISGERTPFVVFGLAKIQRTKLLATLSGLKLEAEMNAVHSSLTFREKVRGARTPVRATQRTTSELSHTGHIGSTMIVLLEGIAPNQQTVVRVTIGKSQGLYSSLSRKTKDKNSALITIGDVHIDIPQHPVILHDMMTRGSKQLSSTLMELRVARPSARLSRGATVEEQDVTASPRPPQEPPGPQEPIPPDALLHPLVIQFSILLQSLSIQAALLPSLQAQYRMEQVSSLGITGAKAKFTIHLPTHHLSFSTRLQDLPTETHLPSSASIQLPQVHVEAELIQDDPPSRIDQHAAADGMVLREGSYLSAVAEIGALEHSLTTDLLNHLVFVQKVFMKEVNEVVQKMAGGDKPVPLWTEEGPTSHVSQPRRLLFTLQLRLKGIIITATTPTQSAVRLETGVVELQLSNRVENISRPSRTSVDPTQHMKIFGKAQVDINVALGQLLRNDMFEEAEPEFQQLAFFRTRICLRNALYNEMLSVGDDGEVVLITLTRPLVCVQPLAVDRAVLVWLNYKNAYEYWSEQRASLNKEVLTATQQVFEKVPQFSSLSSAAHITNNVYLQLTVDDIGICLPLNPCRTVSHQVDSTETRDALVVTLESTIISACNSGSLVCKARFKGFCMRFAPEFETSLDDWKPDFKDHTINLCTVSEGTYEVCSRTVAGHSEKAENAKWLLNVQWQMEGVDLHLDVNIGKHLSALARTLTMLTGAPDTAAPQANYDSDDDVDHTDHATSQQESHALRRQLAFNESLPAFIFDPNLDARQRAKLLEIEMNEQAKTVNDLKMLGASASTIEQEMRRLQELEAVVFHDFRRDVIKKLRRQSVKATSMKDRLGLGPKHHLRSKSFRVPSPTIEVKEPPASCGSRGSIDQASISVDSSPCHTANDATAQKVKFVDGSSHGRHLSFTSGSSDSYPTDEIDNGDVFLATPGHMRTPTPTNVSDTETETITITNFSSDNIGSAVSKSVGGLTGLVTVLDRDTTRGSAGDGYYRDDGTQGGGSGSTPGTATAPLSGHSSTHSSVFPLLPGCAGPITPGGHGSSSSGTVKPLDPSIDLELDVRVCISSGMCNLYTKCVSREEEKRMKKERSFSGGISETPSSPGSIRKKNEGRPNIPSGKLRAPPPPLLSVSADTVFYIPGLDVKVHYESHNIHEETPVGSGGGGFGNSAGVPDGSGWSPAGTTGGSSSLGGSSSRKSGIGTGGIKRASLFTWLTLQSIQRETTVSPNILEFLELALEPLPVPETQHKSPAASQERESVFNVDVDTSGAPGGGGVPYVYSSFPVDVVVYFHMQPSTIRFSCQPVSRVECLLQLPSLNLVFSSKRAEDGSMPDLASKLPATIGGLSVTGVLEDFSLYVFHPYGGKQRGTSGAPYLAASPLAALTDSERKDSLSVMVEFVKFHISRSRKINYKPELSAKIKTSNAADSAKAIIRFSTIVDIGAAHFKYDMRRLTEILAFPRAWYRRSIVRRLFLGDFTGGAMSSEWDEVSPAASSGESPPSHNVPPKRHSSSSAEGIDNSRRENGSISSGASQSTPTTSSQPLGAAGAGSRARDKLRLNFDSEVNIRRSPKLSGGKAEGVSEEDLEGSGATTGAADPADTSASGKSSETEGTAATQMANKAGSWETLVLFAVNFTRLGVQMNMGNVMGNVVWTTKDFKANGRLSIGSTGHKNMYIGIGLGGSGLEAKGGIVGGTIELSEINMYLKIREDPGTEPDHTIGVKLFASQSRLDYMGTSVLMGRVSSFGVTLRDEWKLKQCADSDEDTTRRGATIFILGDLEWDQLQLIISKSTTADLLKMHHKLDEFFSQQFKSSKRVFSSLQPTRHKSSVKQRLRDGNRKLVNVLGVTSGQDARHHRHWQGVLYRVSGLRLTTLPLPLPDSGTVLGGSLELHGKTISLACFHGVNFRSKSWALFSLQEPYINFTSEVQEVPGDPPRDTHIVQNLTFSLGVMEQTHAQHISMATVCRITRNMVFPPQFRTIQEWFHYAFCTSELDNVDRFPSLDRSDSLPSSEGKRSSARLQDHNHSSETIFALPSMQIHLNTKHLQTATTPDFMVCPTDEKPKVECSLVTEFQDHIFVAVDAENFFFLHDMIASYVKDTKEKMARKTKVSCADNENNKESADKKPKVVRVNEPTQLLQQDWREFTCPTWHLEPTVRLLSWATKNLEPYGVDYILQKLGFSHARTTIPKWLQRGCMDPLDKVLSLLMFRMIAAIYDHDTANR
ncbi:transmembrane protein KIAA1109 homolog isoform X4 [Homarus americanus]|uniref:transmembrane protein KIAA1109 homolog isoform X4 n=1 Tax=Homarus americanus TaxID=6706 RepID=UPI001C44C50B|nr:transmembrane protein KIAA1109 homolog isoform X4 [Homarus americanus]